jgi:hypothetical protein
MEVWFPLFLVDISVLDNIGSSCLLPLQFFFFFFSINNQSLCREFCSIYKSLSSSFFYYFFFLNLLTHRIWDFEFEFVVERSFIYLKSRSEELEGIKSVVFTLR